jgi:IclR family pca regulon transcriptional regulator
MDDHGTARRGTEFVQSLERGLAVIRAFDGEHPDLTLSDVARATGLTRATARRFLLTLVDLGYVRTDGRLFGLRPRVLELGFSYLSGLGLPEVALPHMEALVGRVHESSSLCVLDGEDIVYVARVPTRRIMTVTITVGMRLPAYATSMGRVLLAGLPPGDRDERLDRSELRKLTAKTVTRPSALRERLDRIAVDGYALVDEELEPGLRSIAVPVRIKDRVVAAINVALHSSLRSAQPALRELLPPLRETAQAIEADLGSASTLARFLPPEQVG